MMNCRKCNKQIPDDARYCPYCATDQTPPDRKPKRRGNGQGSIYKRGNGWEARVEHHECGRRYSKSKCGFRTKKDAADWISSVTWASVNAPARTFAELYDEWSKLHYPTISKKKAGIYEGAYKKCGALYGMRWNDIGLRHMQTVVNSLKDTYYPRRDCKILFSLMTKYAITAGYSDRDVTANIKLPPKERPHKVPFTADEIAKLWALYDIGNEYAGIILIIIYTGMRYGELMTIRTENIHLDKSYMLGGIKSEAGKNREIPLLADIKPLVKSLMIDKPLPAVSDTTFRKHYDRALSTAGIAPHTIHECRHTAPTLLARAGVQPGIIMEIMGHSSYGQTMEYTHPTLQDKLDAMQAGMPKRE